MALTPEQLEERRHGIWSTDAARILTGEAAAVQAEKLWGPEVPSKPWMDTGNWFESGILDWAEHELGHKIARNITCPFSLGVGDASGTHLDGCDIIDGTPIEAKSSGQHGPPDPEWGKPGTDEVPRRVLIQSHWHLVGSPESEQVKIAVHIGGHGFEWYYVKRDERIISYLRDRMAGFWERHIVEREPVREESPIQLATALPTYKAIIRTAATLASVSQMGKDARKVFEEWQSAKWAARTMEKYAKGLEAELLRRMGDSEAAKLPKAKPSPQFLVMQESQIPEAVRSAYTRRQLTGKTRLPELET